MTIRVPALLSALALSAPLAVAQATEKSAGPRGIVLILVDDLGWRDLACTGSTFYETPHLDALRRQGMQFTSAYASAAVCSPTRAAFLTGRSPARLGITDWIHHASRHAAREAKAGKHVPGYQDPPRNRTLRTPKNRSFLAHTEHTLAELLATRDFRSAYVGKWHLGGRGWFPTDQGFERNAGGAAFGQPPRYFDPYANKRWPEGIPTLPPRKKGEYLTAREADEAVRFLKSTQGERFFLCYAPYAVHSPIQAPRPTIDRYRKKLRELEEAGKAPTDRQNHPPYAAMIEELDRSVGRILATLRALDVEDDTLVLFTSDNGGASHFRATDNAPLRRGKGFPYEAGIRVPLLVRYPKRIEPNTTCDTPVISADVFPTLAELTHAETPRDLEIDGMSLVPLFDDPSRKLERPMLTWHFPHYWWGGRVTPWSAMRMGHTKVVHWYETDKTELYDLAADPGETKDLAEDRPAQALSLRNLLVDALTAQGAQFPRRD